MERYTYEIIFTRLDGQPDEIQQHTSEELARECFRLFCTAKSNLAAMTGRQAWMRFWKR